FRRARDLDDIRACMDLQRAIWGFSAPEEMASPPLLILANRYGGCVLLAESADNQVIGFSYALLARAADKTLFWWSHMTAISPRYQGRSIGTRLKLAQREAALEADVSRICWSFDPLQALNAHFN